MPAEIPRWWWEPSILHHPWVIKSWPSGYLPPGKALSKLSLISLDSKADGCNGRRQIGSRRQGLPSQVFCKPLQWQRCLRQWKVQKPNMIPTFNWNIVAKITLLGWNSYRPIRIWTMSSSFIAHGSLAPLLWVFSGDPFASSSALWVVNRGCIVVNRVACSWEQVIRDMLDWSWYLVLHSFMIQSSE